MAGSSTTSSADASSCSAARRRASATTARVDSSAADPPSWSERDPNVPVPRATASVSPCTTRTASTGRPVSSATSMASAVARPCPCGDEPVVTTASTAGWSPAADVPDRRISTRPNSLPARRPLVTST